MIRSFKSKFDSSCWKCNKHITAGELIHWDTDTKAVYHNGCFDVKEKVKVTKKAPAKRSKPKKKAKTGPGTITIMKLSPAMAVFAREARKLGIDLKKYSDEDLLKVVRTAFNYETGDCPF